MINIHLLLFLGFLVPATFMGTAHAGLNNSGVEIEHHAILASPAPPPRPSELRTESIEQRCTADGRHCISLAAYFPDICRTIEAVAEEAALDPHFFARLLWKESLFDASAISPKGAQGIAQFMPGTAELRGLADPFNPAEALTASAHYLSELSGELGNIGLAAVAYNGGEARAAQFVAGAGGLAAETRDYVQAITGHPAEVWRDAPPPSLNLDLKPGEEFLSACVKQAEGRSFREFQTGPVLQPWGVVVATNRDRRGAERQVARLTNRLSSALAGEAVAYVRERRPGLRGTMWFAQVGRKSRAEADQFCVQLRRAGGECMVLKNEDT